MWTYDSTDDIENLERLNDTCKIQVLGISQGIIYYKYKERKVIDVVWQLKNLSGTIPHDAAGSRTPGNVSVDETWLNKILELIHEL